MKAQPAAIGPRDALRFSKESDEQQKHEISIDLRLQLEVAREFFRLDFAPAGLELQRGVQRVIDFLDEDDERTDVRVVQSGARIVPLKLFDEPARIINADEELIVRVSQKSAREFAQFARRRARQFAQLRATRAIDDAIFEIDSDLRVGALEESLDLAEERFVHELCALNPFFAQRSQRKQRRPSFLRESL